MTAPEPTVCPTCEGNEEVGSLVRDHGGAVIEIQFFPCPDCCCSTCGRTTDTPPVCLDCDLAADATYERRCDT
jgi:hypothetical protein